MRLNANVTNCLGVLEGEYEYTIKLQLAKFRGGGEGGGSGPLGPLGPPQSWVPG